MAESTERVELPATQARQGRQALNMLWVLAVSLVLAAGVVFVVWMAAAGDFSRANREARANVSGAAGLHQPPSAAAVAPTPRP